MGVREKQRNICSGLIFLVFPPPPRPPQKNPQLCRCFAFLWYRGCAAALRLRAVSSGFFPWKGRREAGMGRWGRWHRWLGRRLAHGEAGEGLCPRQKPMARVCPRRFSREDLGGKKMIFEDAAGAGVGSGGIAQQPGMVPLAEPGVCHNSHVPASLPGGFGRRSQPGSQPLPSTSSTSSSGSARPGEAGSALAAPCSCWPSWGPISWSPSVRIWERRRRREGSRGQGLSPLPMARLCQTLSCLPGRLWVSFSFA